MPHCALELFSKESLPTKTVLMLSERDFTDNIEVEIPLVFWCTSSKLFSLIGRLSAVALNI